MAKGRINIVIAGNASLLNKELAKAERAMKKTGRNLTQLGGTLFKAIGVPTIAIGTAAISTSMKFEKMEKSLEAIMGSGEAAKKELNLLRKVAEMPGVTFEQAVQGSSRLQAVGISADQARTAIQEFGNAVTLSGGGAVELDGVLLALTQVKGAGKVLSQDLKQITTRIPILADVIKNEFGANTAEAINAATTGFDDFQQRLISAMQREIPRAANTLENSFVNLKVAGETLLDVIGRQLIEDLDLQTKIEAITGAVNRMAGSFREMNPIVKNTVYAVAGIGTILGGGLWVGGKIAFAIVNVAEAMRKLGLVSLLTGKNFKLMWSRFFLPLAAAVAALEGLEYLFNKLTPAQKAMTGPVNALMTGYGKLKDALSMASDAAGESAETVASLDKKYQDLNNTTDITAGNFNRIIKEQLPEVINKLTDSIRNLAYEEQLFGQNLSESKISAYEGAIRELIELGLTPASAAVKNLKAELDALYASLMPKVERLQKIQSGPERFGTPDSLGGESDPLRGVSLMGVDTTFNELLERGNKGLEERNDLLSNMADMQRVAADAGQTLGEQIAQLAVTGQLSFQKLAQAAIEAVSKIVRAKLVSAVTSFIESAFANFGIWGGFLAAGAGAVVGGLFDAAVSKISGKKVPALAQGGVAFGPTMAMVGDNSGARVNPEVIAPLDKLKSMMGGNTVNVTGEFRVKGTDLVLLLERQNRVTTAKRGYGING